MAYLTNVEQEAITSVFLAAPAASMPVMLHVNWEYPLLLFISILVYYLHMVRAFANQEIALNSNNIGMALADMVQEAQEPVNETYNEDSLVRLNDRLSTLQSKVHQRLIDQGIGANNISHQWYLNMRYQGTETSIMVLKPEHGDFKEEFTKAHLREFAFLFPDERPIFVDDARVRGIGASGGLGSDGVHLDAELKNTEFTPVPKEKAGQMVYPRAFLSKEYWLTDIDEGVLSRLRGLLYARIHIPEPFAFCYCDWTGHHNRSNPDTDDYT